MREYFTLPELVARAQMLGAGGACPLDEHAWKFEGGRYCGICESGRYQSVFRCTLCGDYDYGERGGPGWRECAESCPEFPA